MLKNILFYITLIILAFSNCDNRHCDYNADKWIIDAPLALREFHNVKAEIMANEIFIRDYRHKGTIFLSAKDTSKIINYGHLPLLVKWFRDKRSYINIDSISDSFAFKQCQYGNNTANGLVYHNLKANFNKDVVIIDSVNLGNGWFAYVTKCSKCLD